MFPQQREIPRAERIFGVVPGEDSATSGPGDGGGPLPAPEGQRSAEPRLKLGGTTKRSRSRSRPNRKGQERVFLPNYERK